MSTQYTYLKVFRNLYLWHLKYFPLQLLHPVLVWMFSFHIVQLFSFIWGEMSCPTISLNYIYIWATCHSGTTNNTMWGGNYTRNKGKLVIPFCTRLTRIFLFHNLDEPRTLIDLHKKNIYFVLQKKKTIFISMKVQSSGFITSEEIILTVNVKQNPWLKWSGNWPSRINPQANKWALFWDLHK